MSQEVVSAGSRGQKKQVDSEIYSSFNLNEQAPW
jgi:hypothetical protein